jgi:TetR/AcrR family transcriptional repressor of nem operon
MSAAAVLPRKRGRPPKADGDYRATRETLYRAGVAALIEKGISSTGLDEILKSVGVPKGSFYNFFESKEAFGAELITLYARYFAHKLDKFFLDESMSPTGRRAWSAAWSPLKRYERFQRTRTVHVGRLSSESVGKERCCAPNSSGKVARCAYSLTCF